MSIRKCLNKDIDSCINLWKTCFQDGNFSDFYFSDVHVNSNSYVYEYNGSVVGYLSAIPFNADVFGSTVPCRYVYGVCISPEFRGRGFMRELMSVVDGFDCFKILIPSVDGLYERFGYLPFTEKFDTIFFNPLGAYTLCSDIDFLNKVYNCYRKRFSISLERSHEWWNILLKSAMLDGIDIVANEGAYAFVKDGRVFELAYISEFYRDTLNIGNCKLHLPKSMSTANFGSLNNYIALMLD